MSFGKHARTLLAERFSFCIFVTHSHVPFSCALADREADGAGAAGVAQHAQEAGVLSAGSAGHGHREETCKKHSASELTVLLRNPEIRGSPKRKYSALASCQR